MMQKVWKQHATSFFLRQFGKWQLYSDNYIVSIIKGNRHNFDLLNKIPIPII